MPLATSEGFPYTVCTQCDLRVAPRYERDPMPNPDLSIALIYPCPRADVEIEDERIRGWIGHFEVGGAGA
jgi:hypothetical protein